MAKWCPGCSAKEKVIRAVADVIGLGSRGGQAGVFLRGVSDYSEGLAQDPALGPYNPGRGQNPLDSTVATTKRKVRRKVSKYQKTFGKNLKALKRKHPRTQARTLMKRAHSQTKRQLR